MQGNTARESLWIPLASVAPVDSGRLFLWIHHLSANGSVYDCVSDCVVDEALIAGLAPPYVIAGSGSLILSFASACARRGVDMLAVCPPNTLAEHRHLLRGFSCAVSYADENSVRALKARAEELAEAVGGSVIHAPGWLDRMRGAYAKVLQTDLDAIDGSGRFEDGVLFIPVHTGALFLGIQDACGPTIRCASVVSSEAFGASHSDGLRSHSEHDEVGDVYPVSDHACGEMRMALSARVGILVGLSTAGAVVCASSALAAGRVQKAAVVSIDAGDRYFSKEPLDA